MLSYVDLLRYANYFTLDEVWDWRKNVDGPRAITDCVRLQRHGSHAEPKSVHCIKKYVWAFLGQDKKTLYSLKNQGKIGIVPGIAVSVWDETLSVTAAIAVPFHNNFPLLKAGFFKGF